MRCSRARASTRLATGSSLGAKEASACPDQARAVRENNALAQGVNIRQGKVTNAAVAQTFKLPCAAVLEE